MSFSTGGVRPVLRPCSYLIWNKPLSFLCVLCWPETVAQEGFAKGWPNGKAGADPDLLNPTLLPAPFLFLFFLFSSDAPHPWRDRWGRAGGQTRVLFCPQTFPNTGHGKCRNVQNGILKSSSYHQQERHRQENGDGTIQKKICKIAAFLDC